MPKVVSSPLYAVELGDHVFPTEKYGLVLDRLRDEDGLASVDIVEPEPADEEHLLLVHTPEYVASCRDGTLSPWEILQLEIPWSPELFDASSRCVQGSILAAEIALGSGAGVHVGGGFHHAFPDHGEGFCVFNDHSIAIRKMLADGRIETALVVDCDLHHGNGTAAVFADEPEVATFSIHQENIYPAVKPASTVDVGLPPGTGDPEYLELLRDRLLPLVREHRPDLVCYVAGADPYRQDQLGSLRLSKEGLAERDRIVVEACTRLDAPLFLVLAGGYARSVDDTVQIHLQSVRAVMAGRRRVSSRG